MIIEQTFFDNEGRIVSKVDDTTLKREGVTTHYDINNNKVSEINYRNDLVDGMAYIYKPETIENTFYVNGKSKHSRIFRRDGETYNKKELINELFYDDYFILNKQLKYNADGTVSETHEYFPEYTYIKNNNEKITQTIHNGSVCMISYTDDWKIKRYVITDQRTNNIDYVEDLETDSVVSTKYDIYCGYDIESDTYKIECNGFVCYFEPKNKVKILGFEITLNFVRYVYKMNNVKPELTKIITPKYHIDIINGSDILDVLIVEKNLKINFEKLNFLSKIALRLKCVNITTVRKDIEALMGGYLAYCDLDYVLNRLELYSNLKKIIIDRFTNLTK